ncbi:VOC family protein [Jannaschia sp. CCS1]|uniref:VOC family protein n=1 Tax=Jannaschia sp. (strain CCS1) TaxID=290400 RepID=UPI000053DB88|nr:VOC family protein [Jannaschia sp. CCS1]ABD53597.1 Glyoxalase/bleomycin resistance protein/dioxygenase [Jannaschia sp. CCS1]
MSEQPQNCACWFEIAVSDLDASMAFYGAVLQQDLSMDDSGPNPLVMLPYNDDTTGIGGHLYPGKPSREGSTIHLVVADSLDAARERIIAAGGEVESPDIQIPPGHFFYARDIDGNSLGMFKLNG